VTVQSDNVKGSITADVSAGVWMPQTKKQRRWRTGLIPVQQWCWNTRSCYDSPFL